MKTRDHLELTPEFAIATCDELWVRGRRMERVLNHGIAREIDGRIVATDEADADLVRLSAEHLSRLREAAQTLEDARVRIVSSARRIAGTIITESTMAVTIHHVSVVTSPEFAAGDAAVLRGLDARETKMRHRKLPIVWRNGSAAVLMHEAVGHAAEHQAPAVKWPQWLHVTDEPSFPVDDRGTPARQARLLTEPPASFRRETFRDVCLRRMSNVVVRQQGAPFTWPEERIEVQLVAGGNYDALRDEVTVEIAVAEVVAGGQRHPVRPFTIRRSRAETARSLAGATGDPIRYPGVICSREGQEIAVGSFAPVMITTP